MLLYVPTRYFWSMNTEQRCTSLVLVRYAELDMTNDKKRNQLTQKHCINRHAYSLNPHPFFRTARFRYSRRLTIYLLPLP